MKRTPQKEQILNYLRKNGVITPIEALDYFGCMRLAARIADLRKDGYTIKAVNVVYRNEYGISKHYTAYFLDEEVAV